MKYMTKQSQLILSIVARYGHVTADEVHREAKKSMPKIAVGTVYRNLNELAETGIIRKIEVPNAPDRFDKTVVPHEHLICPDCGAVEDLMIAGLDAVLQNAVGEKDYHYCLTVTARCKTCTESCRIL